ncbi:MAG: hypothetical protein HY822_25350, partial [Acidobacteria bacterium]|nr:hypothetical protein [Acidobacteriota bacterium]
LYQLAVHPRWFWAEYVQDEIFLFGAGAPPQTSAEGQAWFYLRRLARIDPLLCLLGLAALPGFVGAWRRSAAPQPRLLAAWMGVMAAAILAFSYRNASYLLPLIPALAILAGSYVPLLRGRAGVAALALLAALFPLKAHYGERPWGLPFYRGTVPTGKALTSYCQLGRANDLIVVSPQDEFLSAVLPLAKVRYVFVMPGGYREQRALDFRHLGIVVTVDEFLKLPELGPVFAARLREWNQPGGAPIATAIIARSEAEVGELIARSPGLDFLVPKSIPASPAHEVIAAPPDRLLLLARDGSPDPSRRPDPGSCESLR